MIWVLDNLHNAIDQTVDIYSVTFYSVETLTITDYRVTMIRKLLSVISYRPFEGHEAHATCSQNTKTQNKVPIEIIRTQRSHQVYRVHMALKDNLLSDVPKVHGACSPKWKEQRKNKFHSSVEIGAGCSFVRIDFWRATVQRTATTTLATRRSPISGLHFRKHYRYVEFPLRKCSLHNMCFVQ